MIDVNLYKNEILGLDLPEPSLSDNAKYIAKTRYAIKDRDGKSLEEAKDIFWRVAANLAKADKSFGASEEEIKKTAQEFYELMAKQKFFPNTPCLVNAGKVHQQLSACFVLPVEDTMEGILQTMADMAMIHKSGGGTGFSFSRLRPSGDYISTSGGTTVGPVSFMQAYNDVTAQIKQGGVRRGANMGMLSIEHPDVLRFAVVKLDEYSLTNFNISLAVTNAFMAQLETDKKFVKDDSIPEDLVEEIKLAEQNRNVDERLREVENRVQKLYDWASAKQIEEGYELINPRDGKVMMRLNAYKVFNLVTRLAWQYGDPGLIFIDRMNEPRSNPVPVLGRIEATNPCGEQPLLPYDACNLGSINLAEFVIKKSVIANVVKQSENEIATSSSTSRNDDVEMDLNWEELKKTVKMGIHFLDNVVEINEFPVAKIREMVNQTRRIGLGVMGFANCLFKLKVKYDSEEGIDWAKRIMKFVDESAREATQELAKTRGVFPLWEKSVFGDTDYRPRNMALTTIAPTGTISMLADTSSGIEPVFLLGYQKNTVEGKTLYSVNPILVEDLKFRNLYSEELMERIVKNGGTLQGIEEIPEDMKKIYVTALEISPEWHIKLQAAFQEHTDNAVSKTINLPEESTIEDVRRAYLLSYDLGTKGITIYRSGSRQSEVLQKVNDKSDKKEVVEKIIIEAPKKKPTPLIARGVRIKKKCDMGSVYTSIFYEANNGPVEVFVTLGKSGGYMAGAAEVSGRLASLALKYGADLNEIAEELVGIACGQKVGIGNGSILSLFDAVGKSILEISKGEQLNMFNEEKEPIDATPLEKGSDSEVVKDLLTDLRVHQQTIESQFSACPDCGSPLAAEEGCFKCTNPYCGYSKCS